MPLNGQGSISRNARFVSGTLARFGSSRSSIRDLIVSNSHTVIVDSTPAWIVGRN
jgi:hypothetical protein